MVCILGTIHMLSHIQCCKFVERSCSVRMKDATVICTVTVIQGDSLGGTAV